MKSKNGIWRRLTALALTGLMLMGVVPVMAPEAEAAEWMEPYLNQVVDWGVMRGDANGELNPDRNITRAQFVTMVNRAFGYTEVGPNPFTDVPDDAWFADDIRIAHQAGYFNGTTATTASPNALVTREQAAVLIGRNLRLQGKTGVTTKFADDSQLGTWSRGLVEEASELGIILGYEDGSFRPKANVTRGQVACFLVRALGSLIHEPGDYDNMGVYGNLAVNTSGVTLRNAVITGNLYLTGGVGLGDLVLENVEVQGRIVIAGGGEAQSGENSILLRNVTANTMEVDSLSNQFVTLRAEGLTSIGSTDVRTQGYIEDVTENGWGLKEIEFDAESGARLDLAGNIKSFTNLTPEGVINLAQGVMQKVTVDEKATGSTVNVDATTSVGEFNLDVGTTVSGSGDISHMNINSAGSTSSILPDTIFVRPGIISNIKGQQMDSNAAAESSEDPRLLAGYPTVRNVASRSATAVFSTNKAGTLYWGVSALSDGSLGEEELTTTSTTANPKVIRKGTARVTAGKTEVTAAISGLTNGGSYYVSALLEDNRGQRSAVKVTAFVTPDDVTPAFVTGYPEAILAENDQGEQIIQARVMANKSCLLYYALMPNNATAPTAADFKSNSLSGNLGHGVVELRKNVPWLIPQVNSARLQEETDYDLYLWLTDADGARSSAVRKLDVRTLDKTAPVITDIRNAVGSTPTATSVPMQVTMNEPGTVYWAVVKKGHTFYQQEGGDPLPNSELAKMQIETGLMALRKGRVTVGQADTPVSFTISGLAAETQYDLYFVAKDRAGNYCVYPSDDVTNPLVPPIQIQTLDGVGPTVRLEFPPEGKTLNPSADDSIQLIFSEQVRGIRDNSGSTAPDDFLALYQEVKLSGGSKATVDRLAAALAAHIKLWRVGSRTNENPPPRDASNENNADGTPNTSLDWLVDFRKATVEMVENDGKDEMVITLPYNAASSQSGHNMGSGSTYYFTINNVEDMSGNPMQNHSQYVVTTDRFTTKYATIWLANNQDEEMASYTKGDTSVTDARAYIFSLTPENTSSVPENARWDMLLWTPASFRYDLLVRGEKDTSWSYLGTLSPNVTNVSGGKVYNSLSGNFSKVMLEAGHIHDLFGSYTSGRPNLREFDEMLEFAIVPEDDRLDKSIQMEIQVVAGGNTELSGISIGQGSSASLENRTVNFIGNPDPHYIRISPADKAPVVSVPYLGITAGPTVATVHVNLEDGNGIVYYFAIPLSDMQGGKNPTGTQYIMDETYPAVNGNRPSLDDIPTATVINEPAMWLDSDAPVPDDVVQNRRNSPLTTASGNTGSDLLDPQNRGTVLTISNLEPQTTYLLYLVSTNETGMTADQARCYQFTTTPPYPPAVTIQPSGSARAEIMVSDPSNLYYILVHSTMLPDSSFGVTFSNCAEGSLPDRYANITVLDAMLQSTTDDQGRTVSVFDRYATKTAKDTYYEIIKDPNDEFRAEFPVMRGTGELIQSTTRPFALTGMQGTNRYTLLAVAKLQNTDDSDTLFGFRASREYQNQNADYLQLLSTPSLTPNSVTGTAGNTVYSGKLRITFSDDLYYFPPRGQESVPYQVDTCPYLDGNHTGSNNVGDGYVNIGSITSMGYEFELTSPETTHPTAARRQLEYTVTRATDGAQITFNAGLCGANGSVRRTTAAATLAITLHANTNADGTTTWSVTYSDPWSRSTD